MVIGCLLVLIPSVMAGQMNTDSLMSLIHKELNDSIKVGMLIELGSNLQANGQEDARAYFTEARMLANKANYQSGEVQALFKLAYHSLINGVSEEAISEFDNLIKLQNKYKVFKYMSNSFLGLGTAYLYKGAYADCERTLQQGLALSIQYRDTLVQGDILKNLGVLNAYQSNYLKSIDYFLKAIEPYKLLGDQSRIGDCLTNIGVIYNYKGDHTKSIEYQKKAIDLYRSIGSKKVLATGLNNLGVSYDDLSYYNEALVCYNEALAIRSELNDEVGMSVCYNNIGEVYRDQGDFAKAIECYDKSLEIDQRKNDVSGMAICLLNIGGIHFTQGNWEKAHKYYGEALDYANKAEEKRIVANILNSIAELLIKQEKYDQAMGRLNLAIEICIEIGEKSEEAKSNYFMGEVYKNEGKYAEAIKKYNKALDKHIELGEKGEEASDNIKIGEVWLSMGFTSKAISYGLKGLELSKTLGIKENVRLAAQVLAMAYAKKQDYKVAYDYSTLFIQMHDSIYNLESQTQIQIVEHRFEMQRKEQEIELQNTRLEKQDAVIKQRKILQNALVGGIISVLVVVVLVVVGYMRIRKAKIIITEQKNVIEDKNEELKQGNEELRVTIETVNEQKFHIERAQRELTDSIEYAQYIQNAILPKKETLDKFFARHFVLYKPKNIVSGDFYWTSQVEGQTVIAAADCTGHGVPGAFMSMLGVSFLNDIVNKEYITHTGVILRRLRKEVIHALQQTGVLGEQRDGMDISLCSINFKTLELQFSGAHNPLYIIRSKNNPPIIEVDAIEYGDYILYELKADRMPIALYEKMDRFTSKELKLYKGDLLYMFSDGIIDQFGGAHGKRLRSRTFKEILLRNCTKDLEAQKQAIELHYLQWKATYEQIDDIMVLGLEI